MQKRKRTHFNIFKLSDLIYRNDVGVKTESIILIYIMTLQLLIQNGWILIY